MIVGCKLCGWHSQEWPTPEQTRAEVVWHMYEEHPRKWQMVIGCRPPKDPRPMGMSNG